MKVPQIIEQLDELRARAIQEEWQAVTSQVVVQGWSGFRDTNDALILALHNAYPQLRKAVLAGSKLAEASEKFVCNRLEYGIPEADCEHCNALSTFHAEVNNL